MVTHIMNLKATKFLIIFTFLIGTFFVLFNFYIFATDSNLIVRQSFVSFRQNVLFTTFAGITFRKESAKKCRLMNLDPWNPEILPYLHPDRDPLKGCNVTRVMHTELKNGSIRMLDNTYV
ncbi:unnamed protein product [Wuchereria bancrofti]|uniref:Uncharacterized protein n=1 Tax=Wuchereria bancrofti TaxID=6293 RepID=A0A3P7DRY3_WUCBA|nr:unnamed protein product [Wuchereria bancrofti]